MRPTPVFLQPRLRLFLSADIVGSTSLKQSPRPSLAAASADWFPVIQGFYLETQRSFASAWADALEADQSGVPWGEPPELWKVIGDEIIFTKLLSDHRQLTLTLACWIKAVEVAKAFVRTLDSRLDVKCTAWTAGFPVLNKEVVVPHSLPDDSPELLNYYTQGGRILERRYSGDMSDGVTVDYVGPSIDIGFRLAAHATGRQFVVSVGVAYILTLSNRRGDQHKLPKLRYKGAELLKGVFGGTRYPIFWLDMAQETDLARLEDTLLGRSDSRREDVHDFCIKFFDETKSYTFPPFIHSETETELNHVPADYQEALDALVRNYALDMLDDPLAEAAAEAETPPAGDGIDQLSPSAASPVAGVVSVNFDRLLRELRTIQNRQLPVATSDAPERDPSPSKNAAPIGRNKKRSNRTKNGNRSPRK